MPRRNKTLFADRGRAEPRDIQCRSPSLFMHLLRPALCPPPPLRSLAYPRPLDLTAASARSTSPAKRETNASPKFCLERGERPVIQVRGRPAAECGSVPLSLFLAMMRCFSSEQRNRTLACAREQRRAKIKSRKRDLYFSRIGARIREN